MRLLVYRRTTWWRSKAGPVARPNTTFGARWVFCSEERKTKEQGSPVCSTWDQFHLSDERSCRTAGCERGFCAMAVATRLQKARNRSAADTVRIDAGELAYDLSACAGSEVALGESRLQWQSSFSQLRLSENRRKQFFIFNNAARCMQRRRQRFPTVRTVG